MGQEGTTEGGLENKTRMNDRRIRKQGGRRGEIRVKGPKEGGLERATEKAKGEGNKREDR